MSAPTSPAEAVAVASKLGLGTTTYSDGRVLVTVYDDAGRAADLGAQGFRVNQDVRFPGRAEPGAMYECVWAPPSAEPVEAEL